LRATLKKSFVMRGLARSSGLAIAGSIVAAKSRVKVDGAGVRRKGGPHS